MISILNTCQYNHKNCRFKYTKVNVSSGDKVYIGHVTRDHFNGYCTPFDVRVACEERHM